MLSDSSLGLQGDILETLRQGAAVCGTHRSLFYVIQDLTFDESGAESQYRSQKSDTRAKLKNSSLQSYFVLEASPCA